MRWLRTPAFLTLYIGMSGHPPRYTRAHAVRRFLRSAETPDDQVGDLPHWRQDGALYFVTFRLSDSLPLARLRILREENRRWREHSAERDVDTLQNEFLRKRRRVERWLDLGSGSCILRVGPARELVASAIRYFAGERYELGPFTVASNHVHVLVRPAFDIDLSDVLYSWKRYTSAQLKKLPAAGPHFRGQRHLWQAESFDHIVRSHEELDRISRYIRWHDRAVQEEKG